MDDSIIDYLARGRRLVQKYEVTISDNHGGSVTQTATVTIIGSDDAPVAVTDTNPVKMDIAQPGQRQCADQRHRCRSGRHAHPNSDNPGATVNILYLASPICPL